MSEIEMHYGEALEWIEALEWFIRRQGLEIPTWASVERDGWISAADREYDLMRGEG